MTGTRFYSGRMLLRPETSRDRVYEYLREMGWRMVLEEGDPGRQQNFRAEFEVAPIVFFHYVEDFTSRQRYFYVSSPTDLATDRLATLTASDLSPEPLSTLVRACDSAAGLDKGRALMRLGVGAPHEYSEAIFGRIDAGMRDEDPRVRRLSLWATTYSPWPQYLPTIRLIAELDSEPALRERANAIHDVITARGVTD